MKNLQQGIVLLSFLFCLQGCRTILWGHGDAKEAKRTGYERANEHCFNTEKKRVNPEDVNVCIAATAEFCAGYGYDLDVATGTCVEKAP